MPMTPVTMGIATMRPTYWYSKERSGHCPPAHEPGGFPNNALSNTALISSGFTTPRPDVTRIARPTSVTLRRYGANVEMTRRIVCLPIGRASVDRIVQGIAAGVGFLGGGVIFRREAGVQGLTTAASAWAVAAIGVVAGLGAYVAAVLVTALVLIILELDQIPLLRRMSERAEAAASASPRDRDQHEHHRPRGPHDRGP